MIIGIVIFILITFSGPLFIYLSGAVELFADYRLANRESALIAPQPHQYQEAVIQIYAARTFNWRGVFAVHTWIAIKLPGAQVYTVHQKIGWRILRKLPPVITQEDIPDRFWFNQKPTIIFDLRGKAAENFLDDIAQAVKDYPFKEDYHYWPGPNSNTFIAFIGRAVPKMRLVMPSLAIGKDYLTKGKWFARAVSGTGYQISFRGLLGITLALKEGLEINLLGLVYGINPWLLSIKLPGFGDIGLLSFAKKNR